MSKESLAEGEGFQGGLASPALQEVRSTFIPNVSNLQNLLARKLFNRWETVFAWRRSDFTTHLSKNWQTRSQGIDKSFYDPSYQVLKNAKLIKNFCNNMFFYFFFSRDPLSQNYFPLPAGIDKRPSIKPQCVENNLVMTSPQKKHFLGNMGSFVLRSIGWFQTRRVGSEMEMSAWVSKLETAPLKFVKNRKKFTNF